MAFRKHALKHLCNVYVPSILISMTITGNCSSERRQTQENGASPLAPKPGGGPAKVLSLPIIPHLLHVSAEQPVCLCICSCTRVSLSHGWWRLITLHGNAHHARFHGAAASPKSHQHLLSPGWGRAWSIRTHLISIMQVRAKQ